MSLSSVTGSFANASTDPNNFYEISLEDDLPVDQEIPVEVSSDETSCDTDTEEPASSIDDSASIASTHRLLVYQESFCVSDTEFNKLVDSLTAEPQQKKVRDVAEITHRVQQMHLNPSLTPSRKSVPPKILFNSNDDLLQQFCSSTTPAFKALKWRTTKENNLLHCIAGAPNFSIYKAYLEKTHRLRAFLSLLAQRNCDGEAPIHILCRTQNVGMLRLLVDAKSPNIHEVLRKSGLIRTRMYCNAFLCLGQSLETTHVNSIQIFKLLVKLYGTRAAALLLQTKNTDPTAAHELNFLGYLTLAHKKLNDPEFRETNQESLEINDALTREISELMTANLK